MKMKKWEMMEWVEKKFKLEKKTNMDLKLDKIMTLLSLLFLIGSYFYWVYAKINVYIVVGLGLNFLIWLNAMLLTIRDKKMLRLIKE